MWKVW